MKFPASTSSSSKKIWFGFKLTAILFAFVLLFIALKPVAFAQTQDYLSNSTDPNVPKNIHSLTQTVMTETLTALICQLTGSDPMNPNQQCLGINLKTGKIGYTSENKGALGLLNQGLVLLYNNPVHAGDYFSYLTQNFGIAKSTYAASDGFSLLNPLMPLWIMFRNLTYVFFVFVFVLIGLGIMLRVKIDPRTVMTIQNQIPKIIACLLFITFSFAIAGFLIDLMNLSIFVIYSLFSGTGAISGLAPAAISGKNILEVATQNLNVFNIINSTALYGKDSVNNILGVSPLAWGLPGIGDFANIIGGIINITDWHAFKIMDMVYSLVDLVGGLKIAQLIPCAGSGIPIIGGISCVGQTAIEAGLVIPGIDFLLRQLLPYAIIYVVVLFAVFATLIRIFIMLLKAYVFILLDVIFAPFWIMTGLVPGSENSKGFGSWLKDISANLAVFPAVYLMFILANVISAALTKGAATGVFVPPFVGNPLAPSGDGAAYGLIGALTSLGLLLITPDVGKMIKQFIKAPELKLGGIGGAFGTGIGIPTRAAKTTAGIYTATKYDYAGEKRKPGTALGGIITRIFR